jgi:uncharacterized protein
MLTLKEKEQQLEKTLKEMKKVVVAFSGGVDSTLVLKKAIDVLGENNVIGVVVESELFRSEEFDQAVNLGHQMGAHILKTKILELEDRHIVQNTPKSWYYSKLLLYKKLESVKEAYHFNYVLDGMIMDDNEDFRPGLQARDELGVRSILQEVGLYKEDVRQLSKQLDLPVWSKPALCSLASRVPYGETLDETKINKINEAEKFILSLDITNVRVRYHNNIARIEVAEDDIAQLVQQRRQIIEHLKTLDFDYVTIDLEGYRTGSMNEVLTAEATN